MSVDSGHVASSNGASATQSDGAPAAFPAAAAGMDLIRARPEVLVGAAFAGGVLAAFLLRRLGH